MSRGSRKKPVGTESSAISPKVAATKATVTAVFLVPAERIRPVRLECLSPMVVPLDGSPPCTIGIAALQL
jgi:hypothetical protein